MIKFFEGVFAEKEVVNFLLDKVDELYITHYVSLATSQSHPRAQKTPFSRVPDLHARNYPIGRQRVNKSGTTSLAETFFEVKTYTSCNSRYDPNITTKGLTGPKGTLVIQEYASEFKKTG